MQFKSSADSLSHLRIFSFFGRISRRIFHSAWLAAAARTVLVILGLSSAVAAQSNGPKRVLILMEEDVSWPVYSLVDENIRATLKSGLPGEILIFSEHLDRDHFRDIAIQTEQIAWIKKKYANSKLDLVIEVGDVPADLFPGVPLMHLNADSRRKPSNSVSSESNSASVWVSFDAQRTLEVARRLQPRARRIVVIGNDSHQEGGFLSKLRTLISTNAGDMESVYLLDLPVPDICKKVSELGTESIVIFMSLTRDEKGQPLISADVIPKIAAASGAPVFTLVDTHVGTGSVGGYVASFAEVGKAGGQLGLRILAGEHPSDVVAQNVYLFDWRQLRRWKIPESALPSGSVVFFRQRSVWETYKWYILVATLLCMLETLLLLSLLWQRREKRKVEASLVEQLSFEKLLSDLSEQFISLPGDQVAVNVEQGLGRIGEFLKMDRVTLFEFSPDRTELRMSFSWTGGGTTPAPTSVKAADLPWWRVRLLRGEVAFVSDANDLPEEALPEREYFRQMGILSAGTVPLSVGGEVNGAISFVSTKCRVIWTADLLNRVRVLGEVFWNALQRKRSMQALLSSQVVLRESEERFRLVANTAPVLIWMSGKDKSCNFFNQGWLSFTGRSMEQELGEGWALGVHPDDLQRCLRTYTASFDARAPFEMEYRLRRFDGEFRWIVDYGTPRFESDGTFCGYIGSAVDITERKTSEESLHTLSGRLINAQEQERARIARELHDDFSQRLALLGISLGQLWEELPESQTEQRTGVLEILRGTKEMSSDLHSLSHQLHSSKLELVGLVSALSGLCKEMGEKYKIEIHFTKSGSLPKIKKDVELCLFRVTQEALSNVVKHSQSERAQVDLGANPMGVSLRITDAGKGFEPDLSNPEAGIGLVGMRERLRLVGGRLSVKSELLHGTEILAEVPSAARQLTRQ
jgi:PAS domain S-box-containing protein